MAFKLYNAPQSTCSQRVRFILNAKKLPFAEVKLDLLAGDQLKPDYLALNPNGVVPTLDHDGAIVIDSSVIMEYLDEIAPSPVDFTPHDPVKRAKMRTLLHFIDEMPAAAVRVPTFNLAFLPRFATMSEEEFLAFAESKPLRREFMLAMGRKGFPQKDMDAALARLRRTYERMDAEIEKSGGPWLLGRDISLADISLMPAIVRMADLGRDTDWQDLPRVHALVRGHSRPSGLRADLLSGLAIHRALSASSPGTVGLGRGVRLQRRLHHEPPRPRIGNAERAQCDKRQDCTSTRSRPAASCASGPIKASMRRPTKASARKLGILLRQMPAGDGRGDARRKFGGQRLAKRQPHGIKLGIDRLGGCRKGQPPVAQRPHGKCHDRGGERRQRTRRDGGGAAQCCDFALGYFRQQRRDQIGLAGEIAIHRSRSDPGAGRDRGDLHRRHAAFACRLPGRGDDGGMARSQPALDIFGAAIGHRGLEDGIALRNN